MEDGSRDRDMTHRPLTRIQKNEILQTIQNAGLTAGDFMWDRVSDFHRTHTFERLLHEPTGSTLSVEPTGATYTCRWWPDSEVAQGHRDNQTWNDVRTITERWARQVATEHHAPDMWATALEQRRVLVGEVVDSEERFSSTELQQIRAKLEEIEQYLTTTLVTDSAHQALVERQLKYLAEAAERSTKTDWWRLFRDIMLTIAVQESLTSDQAKAFLLFAAHQVSEVLGVIKLLTQ